MEKSIDFETNADESKNENCCCLCFQNRYFTNPDLTIEQMIDRLVGFSDKIGMSQTQARELAETLVPKLKR